MADSPQGSGYGGTWKRWIWVYLVVGAIVYAIVYFAFMRDSGGSGGGNGGGYALFAPYAVDRWFARRRGG
jgi:hypothetical protein